MLLRWVWEYYEAGDEDSKSMHGKRFCGRGYRWVAQGASGYGYGIDALIDGFCSHDLTAVRYLNSVLGYLDSSNDMYSNMPIPV